MSRAASLLAALALALAVFGGPVATAAPVVTPNAPYVAGANGVVVEGGGAASDAAAAIGEASGRRVDALWMLAGGRWRFFLPRQSGIDGGLALFPTAPVAIVAMLGPRAGASGIEGVVTIGPQCPVVRKGVPCPDLPYAATLAVVDAAGREVAVVMSDDDGRYRVALPPGRYTIVPRSPGDSQLPFASPIEVTVAAGAFTKADVAYDSGIR